MATAGEAWDPARSKARYRERLLPRLADTRPCF